MRDLFLFIAFLVPLLLGLYAPFVLSLFYIWVDFTTPHRMTFSFMSNLPLSQISGTAAIIGYILLDPRKKWVGAPLPWVMMILLLIWITITSAFFSVAPDLVWEKYDWASKTLIFAIFLPFVLRTRHQIEAAIAVMMLAILTMCAAGFVKTFLSGGGYGTLNIWGGSMNRMSESSSFATIAIASLPIVAAVCANWPALQQLKPLPKVIGIGSIPMAMIATIGTYARTGLVCMSVYLAAAWLQSKRKLVYVFSAFVIIAAVAPFASEQWVSRMSTLQDAKEEASAAGRLEVWKWTWDFSHNHPMGGGFYAYTINEIEILGQTTTNKAFHSIYFEMLGEQGYPGLIIYLTLFVSLLARLRAVRRAFKDDDEHKWLADYAGALHFSFIIVAIGGMFISIAFQSFVFTTAAVAVAIVNHARPLMASAREPRAVRGPGFIERTQAA